MKNLFLAFLSYCDREAFIEMSWGDRTSTGRPGQRAKQSIFRREKELGFGFQNFSRSRSIAPCYLFQCVYRQASTKCVLWGTSPPFFHCEIELVSGKQISTNLRWSLEALNNKKWDILLFPKRQIIVQTLLVDYAITLYQLRSW